MTDIVIILIATSLLFLVIKLMKTKDCDHSEQVFYDASGDRLSSDQSDACFSKCEKCGQIHVIPSGFQSDAHFEQYLHEVEMGSSAVFKKIRSGG